MHQMTRIIRATLVRPSVLGMFILLLSLHPAALLAQTAGEGTITGTVTDATGAVVSGAAVTATNQGTNAATTRTSTDSGLFTIAPLPPGPYTVTVAAKGFKTLKQENLDVVGLGVLSFNPVLAVGSATENVVVTAAPPVLDTDSALLGSAVENEAYSNLPILQSTTQQRDPTAFAGLVPGAQGGSQGAARTPIVGGTANYQGYIYLDGVPAETINQQGDNRTVALNVSLEAVDQFQVNTSVPPAEYMGAGSMNFTMKSGSLHYHGQVSEFVRNTAFDAWTFTQKATKVTQIVNGVSSSVPAGKNIEHTNEFSASIGGYVPHAAHKVFFFVAYDRYHSRLAQNPSLTTIPTALMEQGNFTEIANAGFIVGGQSGLTNATTNKPFIFDPTINNCVGSVCTRNAFSSTSCSTCNGVPTNNVIPTGSISAITQKMESFMPNYPGSPNASLNGNVNPNVFSNNYLSTGIGGRDNHLYDYRVDIDLSSRNRISAVGAMGQVVYANNFGAPYLPPPYEVGDYAIIVPKQYDVEDAFTITDHLTNQFKVGYTRFYMPIINPTDTAAGYGSTSQTIGAFGVTNLPGGQAGTEFPGVDFGGAGQPSGYVVSGIGKNAGSVAPATWTTDSNAASTQLTIPNNYSLVDNVQWLKGKNVITIGGTYQFQGLNNANPATLTGMLQLPFDQYATANYGTGASSSSIDTSNTGYGYASFLIGAVGGWGTSAGGTTGLTLPLQNVATIYSRIKTFSPFVEDSIKINQKLVVDVGLRWDYLPPLHEKFDHFTFLNPTATNPATGTPGVLEFDGNYGGAGTSCQCTTPIQTYWKNFGPRAGIVYSINDKTVFRAASGMVYSQGGGTGGGRVSGGPGASNGAGQALGFNTNAVAPNDNITGSNAGPSFWLNGSAYPGAGSNTDLFGKGYAYPGAPSFAAAQLLSTGNYAVGNTVVTPSSMGYDDPYLSGRAPEYTFWNIGFERTITKDMTLQANYVGDEAHHSFDGNSQNARGYWNNQLDPKYIALLGPVAGNSYSKGVATANGLPLLLAPATTANVAILQGVIPAAVAPAFFQNAANVAVANGLSTSTLTVGQMLTAFPQYSSLQDGWGGAFTDNFSYNAFQLTLSQRTAHGLTFNVNYTYSKNIGDDGTFRSGYNIPAAAIDGHGQNWHQNRIDRSWTSISFPQTVNAYGVYKLPVGTPGHFGGENMLTRQLLGGWSLSGIYTYSSGTPVTVTWSSGGNCSGAAPNAGQCQPSLDPSYSGSARINGSYGSGPNGFNACNIGLSGCTALSYVSVSAFKAPADVSTVSGQHQYLIGNVPRSLPLNLRNPGNQNLNAALRRSFSLPHEWAVFVFEVDCQNVWNKVQFGGPNGGWGAGSTSFGQVTSASGNPRDFQFAGHINF